MTPLEFSVVFSLGLLSGLHCLQMCGPIVLSYSLALGSRRMLAHLAYNSGRILTYMALGALAGAAGNTLGLLGRLAGIASAARIVAGAAMLLGGILMLRSGVRSELVTIYRHGITARFSHAIGRLITGARTRGKFWLGLILGFLPCGLVYAALLKAVETSGALAGALTMLAFGLGTSVALLAVGIGSGFLGARAGRWGARLAPVGMMLFGALLLWRGLAGKPICHG